MESNNPENAKSVSKPTRRSIFHIAGHVIVGVAFAVAFALVFALFVQFIWNGVMPDIFGFKRITFWQAFGIIILAKLLFGGFGHHSHDRWKKDRNSRSCYRSWDRWKEEESPPSWHSKDWQDYKKYWKEKGKASFESYMNGLEEE
jgi:hypothetical protein